MKESFDVYFDAIEEAAQIIKTLKAASKVEFKRQLSLKPNLKYELIIARNSLKIVSNALESKE
jgi:hypothetical protein